MHQLYTHTIPTNAWATACGSENPGDTDPNGESCIQYAHLPNGGVAIRDTKNPDAGELRFTADEMTRFATEYLT